MKAKFYTLFIFIFVMTDCFSQNPWEKYGYKTKPALTLSNGEYQEFFTNDTIVQIGTVLFNTVTNQVIGFIKQDTITSEATLKPEVVSRWLSPDPLMDKYPNYSPYNFTLNNPIIYTDPDGRVVVDRSGKVVATMNDKGEVVYDFSKSSVEDLDFFNKNTKPVLEILSASNVGKIYLNKLLNPNERFLIEDQNETGGDYNSLIDFDDDILAFSIDLNFYGESQTVKEQIIPATIGVELSHIKGNGGQLDPGWGKLIKEKKDLNALKNVYQKSLNQAVKDIVKYRLEKNLKLDKTIFNPIMNVNKEIIKTESKQNKVEIDLTDPEMKALHDKYSTVEPENK